MCCDLAKGPASGGHNQGVGISDWENHAVGSTNMVNRKKFRSQTSDNVDRCSAEVGRVREEKRRQEKKSRSYVLSNALWLRTVEE